VIIRQDKDLRYQASKPCAHCLYIIKRSRKIKSITYSIADDVVTESINLIATSHVSQGHRLSKHKHMIDTIN